MQLLVSLHDVTPAHQPRLERAERLFADLGITRVAYFVVPDFHTRHPVSGDRTFAAWCSRPRPFAVDWVLHGYYHLEIDPRAGGPASWVKRRTLTGGEGEFLTLDGRTQEQRLGDGLAALQSLGIHTNGFVAPAWLSNAALPAAMRAVGLTYTEDHWHVTDVRTGRRRFAPAISWATRTRTRRIGSRMVCPLLAALATPLPAVRVAVHPFDCDHVRTRAQVHDVLRRLLRRAECADYAALF